MNILSNTSIYKYATQLTAGNLTEKLGKLIDEKTAIYLNEDQLEDVFYKIRHRNFQYKAKFAVCDLFRNGTIKLVYNDKNNITPAVPFVAFKKPTGDLGVIVNVTPYGNFTKDGIFTIDPQIAYTMLLAAAYSTVIDKNTQVIAFSGLPELYSNLFVSVLSRMTNMNMNTSEKIRFIMAKFMYMQLDQNEVNASEAAKKSIKYAEEYELEQINTLIPADAYSNLETLIESMRTNIPEMSKITFGLMFDKWIRSYGEPTGFAIEYVPYLIYQFIGMMVGANGLVNVKAMETVAAKDSKKVTLLFDRIEQSVINLSRK